MRAKRTKKTEVNTIPQWYVVNTFSGNEDTVVNNIKGKVNAYGMNQAVQDIRLIKEVIKTEEEIKKEDAPKALKNSKIVTWTVLANGNYKKTIVREKNKYSGYIFIKMIMNDETWFLVRNTPGVTGFIGSSGKGTKPFPVTLDEILSVLGLHLGSTVKIVSGEHVDKTGTLMLNEKTGEIVVQLSATKKIPVQFYEIVQLEQIKNVDKESTDSTTKAHVEEQVKKVEKPKAHFKIGNTVSLKSGEMQGMSGVVATINESKRTAMVNVELFGRLTEVEASFDDIEIK